MLQPRLPTSSLARVLLCTHAALEVLRGRLTGSDLEATPLRKTRDGSGGEEQLTPLVHLRHVAAPSGGSGSQATPGQAEVNSELAAVLARRAQRQAPVAAGAAASP